MAKITNYYELLGISEKASIAEIKAAIADRIMEDGPESQPVIRAIYDLLTDPEKKAAYDQKLRQSLEQTYRVATHRSTPEVYAPPPAREIHSFKM